MHNNKESMNEAITKLDKVIKESFLIDFDKDNFEIELGFFDDLFFLEFKGVFSSFKENLMSIISTVTIPEIMAIGKANLEIFNRILTQERILSLKIDDENTLEDKQNVEKQKERELRAYQKAKDRFFAERKVEDGKNEFSLITLMFLKDLSDDMSLKSASNNLINKSIDLGAFNSLAYFNRGLAYKELKNFDKALADLKMAKEQDSDYEDIDEIIENILLLKDDPIGGISINIDTYNQAVEAYQNRNFGRAVELYTRSIEENSMSDFIIGYKGRGDAKRLAGDLLGAIEDFNKVLEIDTKDGETFSNRGLTHARLGQYEAAMQDLIKAKELMPSKPSVYFGLGNLMMQLGGYSDALKNYDKLIELTTEENPNIGIIYYNRGHAKFKMDNKEGAYRDWGIAANYGHMQAIEILKKK